MAVHIVDLRLDQQRDQLVALRPERRRVRGHGGVVDVLGAGQVEVAAEAVGGHVVVDQRPDGPLDIAGLVLAASVAAVRRVEVLVENPVHQVKVPWFLKQTGRLKSRVVRVPQLRIVQRVGRDCEVEIGTEPCVHAVQVASAAQRHGRVGQSCLDVGNSLHLHQRRGHHQVV